MSKKHNNSFDYIGAFLSDNSILGTEISKAAFESLKVEAERVKNTPYGFSRGNIFEFIEGSKLQVAAATRGKIFNYNPVNAGRGLYQSPDDLSIFVNGNKYCFQAKVSDDANWIADAFSKDKYKGMDRITTSDMYKPVKSIFEKKLRDGSISKEEYDAYIHLKPGVYDPETGAMVTTSNAELDSLCGRDGKVDLAKVERYITIQQNKAFIDECINNTKSVTLISTITGCVFSSAKNIYKYYKNEQDINVTAKNIVKDTALSAGHGLLSSTIANGFKYIGFKSNNFFIRENVNALVFANGVIDIGKSFIYFKKGEISYNDFLANIIGSSAMTVINLGINYCLSAHPLIKLASTIIINQIGNSLFKSSKIHETSHIKPEVEISIMEEYKKTMKKYNEELENYLNENKEFMSVIKDLIESPVIDRDSAMSICNALGLESEFEIYDNFIEKIDNDEIIDIEFKKRN